MLERKKRQEEEDRKKGGKGVERSRFGWLKYCFIIFPITTFALGDFHLNRPVYSTLIVRQNIRHVASIQKGVEGKDISRCSCKVSRGSHRIAFTNVRSTFFRLNKKLESSNIKSKTVQKKRESAGSTRELKYRFAFIVYLLYFCWKHKLIVLDREYSIMKEKYWWGLDCLILRTDIMS